MIKYHNTNLLEKQKLKHCKSLANFVMDKFFSKQKQMKMTVDIHFKKDMFKNENHYGNCIWEDEHRRGNEFTINIDPDQNVKMLLNSIAHELVHVKQWAKGEYYELLHEPKVYKFNGKKVDTKKVDYWDTPWEIEAHGRAIGLVVLWVRANKLSGDELIIDG